MSIEETDRNAARRQVIQLIRDADIKVYNWESLILGKGLGDIKLHLKSMSEFDLDYAIRCLERLDSSHSNEEYRTELIWFLYGYWGVWDEHGE